MTQAVIVRDESIPVEIAAAFSDASFDDTRKPSSKPDEWFLRGVSEGTSRMAILSAFPMGSATFKAIIVNKPNLQLLNPDQIELLYEENNELREVVTEAFHRLLANFSGDVFTLKQSADPEEPEEKWLVLKVKTARDYLAAEQSWESFNQWWAPRSDACDAKLRILLDF